MALSLAARGAGVARFPTVSGVRTAKRPNFAVKSRLWNGSFNKRVAFRLDEHQNRKLAGSEGQAIKHIQDAYPSSRIPIHEICFVYRALPFCR